MKDYVNGKVLNTDSAVLVKYVMDEEDLGDGYKRYTVRRLMRRPREKDYFLYVEKVATDRWCGILDRSEYVVPVSDDVVQSFRKELPEILPAK